MPRFATTAAGDLRCPCLYGQDPRCRQPDGEEQGRLRGAWRQQGRRAGGSGPALRRPTADQAAAELDALEEKWAGEYVAIAPAWRQAW